MEEHEFRRLLDLFPIVRPRNYCITDTENASSQTDKKGDNEGIDYEDPFWQKLRFATERKVDPTKAEKFCEAFQSAVEELVYKELSLDAAKKFIDAEGT